MHYARFLPLFMLLLVAPPGASEPRASADAAASRIGLEPAGQGEAAGIGWPGAMRPTATRKGPLSRAPLAKGVFLVASESLNDPNFSQTVVLLLEYDETGAVGLIINRPTEILLGSLLPEEEHLQDRQEKVFIGGPVGRTQLFLLLRSKSRPRRSEQIVDGVYASTSLNTLREIISGEASDTSFQAYAGYSGWGPGQLDAELARGDWLVTPADSETVFDRATDSIWRELIRKHKGLWVHRDPVDPSRSAFVVGPVSYEASR